MKFTNKFSNGFQISRNIGCVFKMLTYFIFDLLVRYVVIFWHVIVVTCCELFWINFQCCDL